MDDIVVRSKYPRHSVPGRRKRRNSTDSYFTMGTFTRQIVISVIILAMIAAIKYINSPATNYLSTKIQGILFHNVELKSVYNDFEGIIGKIKNSKLFRKEDTEFGQDAVPVSGGFSTQEDTATNNYISEEGNELKNHIDLIKGKYKFTIPVEGVLSSPYGERVDVLTKTTKFHRGIDIEATEGIDVKAALTGEVVESGLSRTYGNYIKIQHDDAIVTVYAHCSQLLVKKGQKVKQGDIIAKVGSTGISIGSHLHFETWVNGKDLDPLNFVSIPSDW